MVTLACLLRETLNLEVQACHTETLILKTAVEYLLREAFVQEGVVLACFLRQQEATSMAVELKITNNGSGDQGPYVEEIKTATQEARVEIMSLVGTKVPEDNAPLSDNGDTITMTQCLWYSAPELLLADQVKSGADGIALALC